MSIVKKISLQFWYSSQMFLIHSI